MNASPAPAPPPVSPTTRLKNYIREHLLPLNNAVVAASSLLAVLDLLVPRYEPLVKAVCTLSALVAALLVLAAIFPQAVDRVLSALGRRLPAAGSTGPGLRGPRTVLLLVLLAGVSVATASSLINAPQGGTLVKAMPTLRDLQVHLLELQTQVGQVQTGVDAANSKLDTLQREAEAQKRQAAQDPLALGMVTITIDAMPNTTANPPAAAGTPVLAAVYLNAPGTRFAQTQLRIALMTQDGRRELRDLSSSLGAGAAPGAVQVKLLLPRGTTQLTTCLSALYPDAGHPNTALARYSVAGDAPALTLTATAPPQLVDNTPADCQP